MKEKILQIWSWLVEFFKSSSLAFLALALSIELINLSLKPSAEGHPPLALFNNLVFSWILIGIYILYLVFLTCSKKLIRPDILGILFAAIGLGFLLDFKFPFVSLLALFLLIALLITAWSCKEQSSTSSGSEQEQTYGREEFAKGFLDMVLEYKPDNKDKDVAEIFGLQASWGSGKTKTIEFIKEYAKTKKKLLVIEFNPWYCTDPSQISSEFISVLKKGLKDRFPLRSLALNADLENYKKLLNTQYQSTFEFLLNPEASREHEFKGINKFLSSVTAKAGERILIIIDDIDRLETEECVKTLQLIRQLAAFKGLEFIVAYDKQHLHKMLKKMGLDFKYLDKIFPNEIDLPQIPERHLIDILINNLRISEEIKKGIYRETGLYNILSREIKTFRDLEKLSQSFNAVYRFLGDNVDPYDLLVLKLLGLKYHKVFHNLKESRAKYLYLSEKSSEPLQYYFLKEGLSLNNEKELLEYLFEKAPQEAGGIMKSILVGNLDQLDRLRTLYSHELYFTLGYNYENSKIKLGEFKSFMNTSSLSGFAEKIEEYCSEDKYEFFIRLLKNKYLTDITKVYEKFFSIIFALRAQPRFEAISDQLYIAKLLSDKLLAQQEEPSLRKKIKDCLWSELENYKQRHPDSALFILIFLYQSFINLKAHRYLGYDPHQYAPSGEGLLKLTKECLNDYLDINKICNSDYFFVSIYIGKALLSNTALEILRVKLNASKDFFKLFLEYLIASREGTDGRKQFWIQAYFYKNENIVSVSREYHIYSSFPNFQDLNDFIKSIDKWQSEEFTKEYLDFSEQFINSKQNCLYDFQFQHLSPQAKLIN
jgi:hypothetical protein